MINIYHQCLKIHMPNWYLFFYDVISGLGVFKFSKKNFLNKYNSKKDWLYTN